MTERDHHQERLEHMARAVSFVMLGVEDRWPDWVPTAEAILADLAAKVGLVERRAHGESAQDKGG
jgi:hypothetical protein